MADASRLFSQHYGVWGPLATSLIPSARQGKRVEMSPSKLRRECCADLGQRETQATDVHNEHVRAVVQVVAGEGEGDGEKEKVIGHVLATRWVDTAIGGSGGRRVCWITQVVVHTAWRKRGVATAMLRLVNSSTPPAPTSTIYAVLTSHAATLRACARAFKDNAPLHADGALDLGFIAALARPVVRGAPVKYVREAELRGRLFHHHDGKEVRSMAVGWMRGMREEIRQGEARERGDEEFGRGAVASAYTRFYVDHGEPDEAVAIAKREGGDVWKLGELGEGYSCTKSILKQLVKIHHEQY
ncbi:hypothetical protein BKA80DRAFT_309996 [Phyllosticta citrichinensis]